MKYNFILGEVVIFVILCGLEIRDKYYWCVGYRFVVRDFLLFEFICLYLFNLIVFFFLLFFLDIYLFI